MPDTMATIGDPILAEKLRHYREEVRGFSREELSKKSGISEITIYVAETRRRDIRLATVRAWADALGVKMGDLLDE